MPRLRQNKFGKLLDEALALPPRGGRLRPAVILMKRGTVIKAAHCRLVRGKLGMSILVVGIGPGMGKPYTASGKTLGQTLRLPDFYRVMYQSTGKVIKPLFGRVLTINILNIADIGLSGSAGSTPPQARPPVPPQVPGHNPPGPGPNVGPLP